MRTKLLITALCATSLTATACTTNPETGEREFPTRTVIGAGLGALGGYLLGDLRGLPAPERLALAVAYGSAAAGLPGTTIPRPSDVHADRVSVTTLALG